MLCPTSAELLAAVDFGNAMSNPLHKKIDFRSAALDSDFARHTFTRSSPETRFLPGYFPAKTKIYTNRTPPTPPY
ncbi:hypothetical protein [Microcoleus sp.]|uniref:hypothetical protein n=1 Tax=Microcoleus sp. TaxID=44472 RepID=UPI003594612B